jgi:hypothetical protein
LRGRVVYRPEHRWNPDSTFLIFTAYFDESDTHGLSPTLVMAAFLGSARQWELFGRKIRALRPRDGFKVFHAKDFKALRGEFRGWGPSKCVRLLNDAAVAIRDGLDGRGYNRPAAHAVYYRISRLLRPERDAPRQPIRVCFRACMIRLIQIVIADMKRHKLHAAIPSGNQLLRCQSRRRAPRRRAFVQGADLAPGPSFTVRILIPPSWSSPGTRARPREEWSAAGRRQS